jgi:DNA polymerase
VVFGVGDAAADLLFVGEGPGFHEDRLGEPFVGQAGKLLTDLLAGIGLRREDVYIANVVKCRPPENRDPLPDEIEACSPNLVRQIQTIRPRVICTLGRFATRLVAQTDASISSVRGRAKAMEVAGIPVVVLPVFHPAAALYTPANRTVLEQDFQKLRRLLEAGERALVPDPSREPAVCAEAPTDLPIAPPEPVEQPLAPEPSPASSEPRPPGDDRTEQLHLW